MDIRKILIDNITVLKEYHRVPSFRALAVRADLPQSTLDRILKARHYPTLEAVEALAGSFNLQAWQLLTPSLDPANPPIYLTTSERRFYDRIKQAVETTN